MTYNIVSNRINRSMQRTGSLYANTELYMGYGLDYENQETVFTEEELLAIRQRIRKEDKKEKRLRIVAVLISAVVTTTIVLYVINMNYSPFIKLLDKMGY